MKAEIVDESVTANTEFLLIGGKEYVFTIGGSGTATVDFWDGYTWKTYDESDGTASQGFIGVTPRSGRVRVAPTGTVIFNAIPRT